MKVETRMARSSLDAAMRKLWADHAVWTRHYAVAALAGSPDADEAAARLLRNQEEIGAAFTPYFGHGMGDTLAKLLKENVTVAVDLVAAAKTGDQEAFVKHDERWSDNVEQIADLLASANPHWPLTDILDLLSLHLTLTKQEIEARLQGDWAADVKAFDDAFVEAMILADTLSAGIAKMFPARFTPG